jgi:hypothetical protein
MDGSMDAKEVDLSQLGDEVFGKPTSQYQSLNLHQLRMFWEHQETAETWLNFEELKRQHLELIDLAMATGLLKQVEDARMELAEEVMPSTY